MATGTIEKGGSDADVFRDNRREEQAQLDADRAARNARAQQQYDAAMAAGVPHEQAFEQSFGAAGVEQANIDATVAATGGVNGSNSRNAGGNLSVQAQLDSLQFGGTTHSQFGVGADGNATYAGQSDARNYMYGRNPYAADNAVAQGAATGGAADLFGRDSQAQMFAAAGAKDARLALRGDWTSQSNALGGAQANASSLAGLEATQGPSAAMAQLQQGTNQGMQSQLALARSGRGFGGNAAAMGQASTNMAGISANGANSAAALSAQEQAAWRGRQAANLGAAGGLSLGAGSQYGDQAQADLASANQNRSQNDSAQLAFMGQGSQNRFNGAKTSLEGQALGDQIRGRELGASQTREDNILREWSARSGFSLGEAQRSDQKEAGYIGAAASGVATLAPLLASSDRRAKREINRTDDPALAFARSARPQVRQPDMDALDAVAAAPGHTYRYRNPSAQGAAPGDQYGPMAQDLAKTPAGRSAVIEKPDGKLAVDTGRLSLVNTSAISAQQRELDALKAKIEAFGAQPGASYPVSRAPSRGDF